MKHLPETGRDNTVYEPSPKGFRMPGDIQFEDSIMCRIYWWRYVRLTNKPRFPEEVRLIGSEYANRDRV